MGGSSLIAQLKKDRQHITNQNDKIVDFIVETCVKNIKFVNSIGTTRYVCEVPAFIVGFPIYNITSISILVNKKLKKMDFSTTFIDVDKILVSWSTK